LSAAPNGGRYDGWRPQLVALDIDGTLLGWDQPISSAVLSAVRQTARAGVPVVIATGRAVLGTAPVLEELALPDGVAVCSNGAVTVSHSPVRVTSAVTFDAGPAVAALLDTVPSALVAVEVVGQGYRVSGPFPDGEISGDIWVEPIDSLVAEPVTRVVIRDPDASAEEFAELAEGLGLHGINYFVGHTAWLDLAPVGVSKASALEDIVRDFGLSSADVLAIGDGHNDLEMLTWAGRGVAMGDAALTVQEVADDVTETLERDGAALELRRWFD
jgi:hydroxymethylpyrimidine pyrophosphatase-like HAD family hydrolase